MALSASYNTGTASINAGETAVTGQGTSWLTAGLQTGDVFVAAGLQAEIAVVNSNTSITLADAWAGSNRAAASYRIRYTGDMARGLKAMTDVLSSISGGILYAFSQLAAAANKMAYFTGAGAMALTDLTAHGRAFLALSGGNGKFFRSTGANTGVMQDILGTVSQSGGVPTGAIVERGSGANGEYVRFADGTQICTGVVNVPGNDQSAAGGFVTPSASRVTWTYPASFVSGSTVHILSSIRIGVVAAVLNNPPGTSSVAAIGMWGMATSSTARDVSMIAIGRWF